MDIDIPMPVMTIISCRIFEDEIVHLIESDQDLDEVILIETEGHQGLSKKLIDRGYPHKILPFEKLSRESKREDKFTLIINIIEFGLEAAPSALKDKVYSKIEQLTNYSNLILLFYGLCGNVLGNVEKDFEELPCTVHILKEDDGEIVDDCIGAVLGGRGAYLETLKSFKGIGIYFLSPMSAANWRELLQSSGLVPNPDDVEMTKFIFDYSGYKKVAKIDTGLGHEKDFERNVEEFARTFNFDVVEIEGGTGLIERCYKRAKATIMDKD